MCSLSVVIPAYNEEPNVAAALKREAASRVLVLDGAMGTEIQTGPTGERGWATTRGTVDSPIPPMPKS